MVHRGPRPEHRRGTTGRPYKAFRKRHVARATNCGKCGKVLRTGTPCTHPTHQGLKLGCPTAHDYPTLQHTHPLIEGGHPRSDDTASVWCVECNTRDGQAISTRRTRAKARPQLEW